MTTPPGSTPEGPPWLSPEVLVLAQRVLRSHRLAFGRELVVPTAVGRPGIQIAQDLFVAPMVVLAHDDGPDPRLIYGNREALTLWHHSWATLVGLPSRLTAEAGTRAARQAALDQALALGGIDGYAGVRIDSQGRRFQIRGARLWSLLDENGRPCGQAAAFSDWWWLP